LPKKHSETIRKHLNIATKSDIIDMNSNEKIKLHTLLDKFPLSDISFGIESIDSGTGKNKNRHFGKPHRHDSYFIKYIIEGSGIHNIDFVDYEVQPFSVFLMAPGQVHSFNIHNVRGLFVYFKTEMVEMNDLPFFNYSFNTPALYLGKKNSVVDSVFHSLLSEYQNRYFAKNELIKAFLQSLLILMTRKYFQQQEEEKGISLPKHVKVIKELNKIIDKHFIEQRNISFYSDALHISSRQLNNILKENMGTSISEKIHQRTLVEAKRLLCYTDKTISEIAYELNFSDKAYFHRFFKLNENITPVDFRKRMLENSDIS